jgi:putative membrane protein
MLKKVALTTALGAFGIVAGLGHFAVAQTNQPATQSAPTNRPTTPSNSTRLSARDTQFMMRAHQGNMAEVELSRLALEPRRGASTRVRQYAEMMIRDHTQADTRLLQLGQQKGFTVPPGQDLDAEHRQIRDQLARLSGTRFDQAYMSAMHRDHVKTVALFQQEAQRGEDRDVRAFATQLLPALRQHLQMARAITDGRGHQGSHSAP